MKLRGFLASAVAPLNKLKYPQKFILISLLFILPLAVVIYLLIGELNTRIDHFGWREKYGTEYLRSLRMLLEHVQQHRSLTYEAMLKGETAPNNQLLTLRSQIDGDFEAMARLDQQYGAILGTTSHVKALEVMWEELESTLFDQNLKDGYELHSQFINKTRNVMALLGNTSFLILDPELDSYYMMDTVLLKLPEGQERLAQMLIMGQEAVRHKVITSNEKVQLIILASLIKSNLETMNSNVYTALSNNPGQNLKQHIETPFNEASQTTEQFLQLIDNEIINTSPITLDPAEFEALGNKALQANFDFYDVASPALENLLQARIDNLSQRRFYILSFTLGSTVVAFLIGLSVMRAISRPLSNLAQATRRLGLGDLSTRVIVASGGEIGQVGSAFNRMAEELQISQQRVVDHTRRLEIVAALSGRLNAILNLEELLTEVVNQIKNSLGFYHVHIYLLDNMHEKLTVVEGTGAAGAEMKAQGHSIRLDAPTSLVARAARTNEIVKVDNVRQAADWLPNPLLPDTYSEMAVPFVLEGQVVGVLDVQQDKVAGLDEGDATLLRTLANQISIAIRNARQFAEVQAALAEAREAQQQYIEQVWDRIRVTRKSMGRIQFSLGESTTLSEEIIAHAQQQALSCQEPTVVALNGQPDSPHYALVVPVRLRDVAIGDLQLHQVDPDREWTENELALINAVVDQVAQIAENLRLLDESQERASREQLVSQISNRMRRAPDMESLMKIAVTELSRALGPARTFVHMDLKAEEGRQ